MRVLSAAPLGWYAPLWQPWLRHALTAVAVASLCAYIGWVPVDPGTDTMDYYLFNLVDPYSNDWGALHAYVYSPAYGQVLYPFTLLPFDVFFKITVAVNLAALVFLVGPVWAVVALPVAHTEIVNSQIHLLLASAAVLMVRHPAAWAFMPLTKVTPGVTILWYVGRREWRNLGVAIGVTGLIVAVSATIWPTAWIEWLRLLSESSTRHVANYTFSEWPAIFRLPIGAGLVWIAARRNRPAALPVIVLFVLPSIWVGAMVMLLAVPRMLALGPRVGAASPWSGGFPRPRKLRRSRAPAASIGQPLVDRSQA